MNNNIVNTNNDNILSYLENIYFNKMYLLTNNLYNKLLDSSLISQSNRVFANVRLVKCGDYLQLFFYSSSRYFTNKSLEKEKTIFKENINNNASKKEYEYRELILNNEEYTIDKKNIDRSKISLQNLVKTNEKIFTTFITLTFAENITDIKEANRKFNIWRRNLKRLFPGFAYVCVPEFQKRGAVHYHLLTNIDYTSTLLSDEIKIYKPNNGWQVGKNIKGWNYGYSLAINMSGFNLAAYMTKYFTKDIDNRLFGKHRYFYSQNLEKPSELCLDLSTFKGNSRFLITTEINSSFEELCYLKEYQDMWGEPIIFCEYKMKRW